MAIGKYFITAFTAFYLFSSPLEGMYNPKDTERDCPKEIERAARVARNTFIAYAFCLNKYSEDKALCDDLEKEAREASQKFKNLINICKSM